MKNIDFLYRPSPEMGRKRIFPRLFSGIMTLFMGLSVLFTLTSCEEALPRQIFTRDYSITIPENPVNGQVLFTVEASHNFEHVNFFLLRQDPEGALKLDKSTGELSVANAALFDFEKRSKLCGNFMAAYNDAGAMGTISIFLLDVDDIQLNSVGPDENPPHH